MKDKVLEDIPFGLAREAGSEDSSRPGRAASLLSEELLERKGVKPTAMRLLVLKALAAQQEPVALSDLESCLETVDKSTIFRALTLFLEHHVVHAFEDGSGILKYELCHNPDGCSVDDMHIHFYCMRCHRTLCLPSVRIPIIELPEGFEMESVNYMVKGLCPHCKKSGGA